MYPWLSDGLCQDYCLAGLAGLQLSLLMEQAVGQTDEACPASAYELWIHRFHI